jgi:hypothetical protein
MLADTYNVDGMSPGRLLLSHNNFLPLSRHVHDAEQKYVSIILWRHQHEDGFHVREITPQNLRRHLREDGFHLHEITPQNHRKRQNLPLSRHVHDAEQKYVAITLWRHLREDGFHLREIIPQNLQKHQYKDELHLLKMTLPNLTKTNRDKEEKLDQGV